MKFQSPESFLVERTSTGDNYKGEPPKFFQTFSENVKNKGIGINYSPSNKSHFYTYQKF